MKKLLLTLLICPVFCLGLKPVNASPQQNDLFEFALSFKKSETRSVQNYLDKKLGRSGVFTKTEMDATVTLDNGMSFYIRMKPGELKILFDKTKNSPENFTRMKEACEVIKSKFE